MKRILFIGHDASRTGAPMVLLHLMRWLRENQKAEILLVLLRGGDMLEDFRKVCTTLIWETPPPRERIRKQLLRKFTGTKAPDPKSIIETVVKQFRPEIIYGNTVAAQPLAIRFKAFSRARVISHIHELDFSLDAYFANEMKKEMTDQIDRFITVSEANRKVLTQHCGLEEKRVSVVHEFIDTTAFSKPASAAGTSKREWKLDDYFIVGGSGMPSWRKGFDLFIQTAAEVSKQKPAAKIAFVWVGKVSDYDKSMLRYQVQRHHIQIPVLLTGQTSEPSSHFQDFDLFYLSSREDPFPLVCLEAASLEKPVLCFEHGGGMPEFAGTDAGWIMPYEDVRAVATQIISLSENQSEVLEKGKTAASKVRNYDVKEKAPLVLQLIGG